VVVASLVLAASAAAEAGKPDDKDPPPEIKLGYYSQQIDRSRARIGASIDVKRNAPGRKERPTSRPDSRSVRLPVKGGAVDDLPQPYPALPSDSTLARNPEPAGPGSFWYPDGPGTVCIYVPDSPGPCFTPVGPSGSAGPALDPGAIAASAADRLPLFPGRIATSPRVEGLTGTASWVWLDPAPETEELTVSLAGETVTVTAEPSGVEWQFGDGVGLSAGAGRPYRPGAPPAEAVLHWYGTRCLPGDRGRNPYVLGSCGSAGYRVEAAIVWRISYTASGPVEASGTLPTRTTETSVAYPVSEARAFLVPAGSR
jgi:hypothetical protein